MFAKSIAAFAVAVTVAGMSTAQAQDVTRTGTLRGTNTVDHVNLPITVGTLYEVRITATSSGATRLKTNLQYWAVSLPDAEYRDLGLAYFTRDGQTTTFRFRAHDNNPDNSEYYRLRLGRKIGTRQVDYTIRMSAVEE